MENNVARKLDHRTVKRRPGGTLTHNLANNAKRPIGSSWRRFRLGARDLDGVLPGNRGVPVAVQLRCEHQLELPQ